MRPRYTIHLNDTETIHLDTTPNDLKLIVHALAQTYLVDLWDNLRGTRILLELYETEGEIERRMFRELYRGPVIPADKVRYLHSDGTEWVLTLAPDHPGVGTQRYLFGTRTLPTPWSTDRPLREVLADLRRLHPDEVIVVGNPPD